MPAEMSTGRRYLNIQNGFFKERTGPNGERQFNRLSRVHLVNITFKKAEKEGKFVGDVLQIHLIDFEDYFIVSAWVNSSYARAFFRMMEYIDLSAYFSISVNEQVQEGKKKGGLFIYQYGQNLKWKYTSQNMQDLPALEQTPYEKDGKTEIRYDDTLQQLFFMEKINTAILPNLKRLPNPFPGHRSYEGNTGNQIAGEYFGKEERHRVPGPVSQAEKNYDTPNVIAGYDEPDDLPF